MGMIEDTTLEDCTQRQTRTFMVEKLSPPYFITGNANSNLDLIWLSEKSWYTPGCKIRITDDAGNSKVFVR